jgi:hypothetical protein
MLNPMGKQAQLETQRRWLARAWIGYGIGGVIAGASFITSLLQPGQTVSLGLLAIAVVGLVFVGAVFTTSRKARRDLSALRNQPQTVAVSIVAHRSSESNGLYYEAKLEWNRQALTCTLVLQEQILNPLVGHTTGMLAYPDSHSGLPRVLETPNAYLWIASTKADESISGANRTSTR